jgi:hypothetical protein
MRGEALTAAEEQDEGVQKAAKELQKGAGFFFLYFLGGFFFFVERFGLILGIWMWGT